MLTVYKASAGSGKTFQLVVEYLKLIIKDPLNYKHILAVTFTNKATNEMKSRILEQMYALANNEDSAYIQALQQENSYTEQYIREQAKKALKNILHDYNRFSINTIDSFTQKVIKSFNRELGITPNFTVELDSDRILEEAVERLFLKIDEDKKLAKWLRTYSQEKIENNLSQRIDDDIKNLGKELFKESFQVFFPEEGESVYTRENLDKFSIELNKVKRDFENGLKQSGKLAVDKMEGEGLHPADFSGGAGRSIGKFFVSLSDGVIPNITNTVRAHAVSAEKWSTKTNKRRAEIIHAAENKLQAELIGILEFYDQGFRPYNTALAILSQLRMLGILSDLKEEIQKLLTEKGILQLSDSNLLLSKIIGESDSPFVYEKIGSFYKHFMLDEFQDTSGLQWKNFKPLLYNSLAEGHNNLIVGDVKQSIYRWRNSDWNILAEQLNHAFTPAQKQDFTLGKNWRSERNIIEFNNVIFGHLKSTFEDYLFSDIEDNEGYLQKFKSIYSSYQQEPGNPNKAVNGYVNINFLNKEGFAEESTNLLIEQVKQLQNKGIRAEDTAILIRKNKEGAAIIEAFLAASKLDENKNYNLSVLSNESLFLFASKAVLLVMETIRYIIDPENKITQASLLQLWLCWLKPELQKQGIPVNTSSGQSLLDFNDYSNWHLNPNFEEEFQTELGSKIEEVRQKVLLSSLDETITQICALFSLFKLETELPFLQTLIDKCGELKTNLSNDLSNLLLWWDEKGNKTSVNINEEVDSIRLLTVHKAKGLEYKAVIIPYLNWETTWGKHAPILWCKPHSAPFNQFPLLPVKAGKNMEASEFSEEYNTEKINCFIDTLNLVYVAFTRAKAALLINCPESPVNSNSGSSAKLIQFHLYEAIQMMCSKAPFTGSFDKETLVFEFGNIIAQKETKTPTQSHAITNYRFKDFSGKIKLRLTGENFLLSESQQHSEKNIGKLIHEILADIENAKDVEKACYKALADGKINQKEHDRIIEALQKNLALPAVVPWFDGTYKVLNERNLLTEKQLLRPDRIMVAENEAIVVDYKTGEKSDKYKKQVQHYAETLQKTGFKSVCGYLWYLQTNELEKVVELQG